MDLTLVKAIVDFFDGREYFMDKPEYGALGHIWVAKHDGINLSFETLTIEPRTGGQFTIAVRIRVLTGKVNGKEQFEWQGYKVCEFDPTAGAFLVGINTRGH